MNVMTDEPILAKNTMELYDEGVSILTQHMGVVRAEQFISVILKEPFDYTKWHQKMADRMTSEEFARIVDEAEKSSPYAGAPSTII